MPDTMEQINIKDALDSLGIKSTNNGSAVGSHWFTTRGEKIDSLSPVDGSLIATVNAATTAEYEACVEKAQEAFESWRMVPAPKRGEIVRQFGELLREKKEALGQLVSYEMGKSYQEGLGEVQE